MTPNILVVRPEIKSMLMEDSNIDYVDEDIVTYEGMLMFVDFDESAEDFRLGFLE